MSYDSRLWEQPSQCAWLRSNRAVRGRGAPTHAVLAVGCWTKAKENLAIGQTCGCQHLNAHGAIDLENGKTAMIDVETVDAAS